MKGAQISGAKAPDLYGTLAARLKSCPDTSCLPAEDRLLVYGLGRLPFVWYFETHSGPEGPMFRERDFRGLKAPAPFGQFVSDSHRLTSGVARAAREGSIQMRGKNG